MARVVSPPLKGVLASIASSAVDAAVHRALVAAKSESTNDTGAWIGAAETASAGSPSFRWLDWSSSRGLTRCLRGTSLLLRTSASASSSSFTKRFNQTVFLNPYLMFTSLSSHAAGVCVLSCVFPFFICFLPVKLCSLGGRRGWLCTLWRLHQLGFGRAPRLGVHALCWRRSSRLCHHQYPQAKLPLSSV